VRASLQSGDLSHIGMVTFDTKIQKKFDFCDIRDATNMERFISFVNSCTPLRNTAIYDSIQESLKMMKEFVNNRPRPPQCHIIVMTDGQDNSSSVESKRECQLLVNWFQQNGGLSSSLLGLGFGDHGNQQEIADDLGMHAELSNIPFGLLSASQGDQVERDIGNALRNVIRNSFPIEGDIQRPVLAPNYFRQILQRISRDLRESEWYHMAAEFPIPRGRAEQFRSAVDLFDYLQETGYFSEHNREPLRRLLSNVQRNDLAESIP